MRCKARAWGEEKSIKYQQFRINVDALEIFPNYSSYTSAHTHIDAYNHRRQTCFPFGGVAGGMLRQLYGIFGGIIKTLKT